MSDRSPYGASAYPMTQATSPYPRPPDPSPSAPPSVPSGLAVAVIALAGVLTAVQVALAVAAWPAADAYREAAAEGRSPWDVFTVYDLLATLMLPAMIATYVVSCLWLHRCRRNADWIRPAVHHERSPIWAWLGWWVPVVGLWFPYQVVRDVQRAGRGSRPGVGLGLWWTGWLVFVCLGRVTGQLTVSEGLDPSTYAALPVLEAIAAVATVLALVRWVAVVRRITDDQREIFAPR